MQAPTARHCGAVSGPVLCTRRASKTPGARKLSMACGGDSQRLGINRRRHQGDLAGAHRLGDTFADAGRHQLADPTRWATGIPLRRTPAQLVHMSHQRHQVFDVLVRCPGRQTRWRVEDDVARGDWHRPRNRHA